MDHKHIILENSRDLQLNKGNTNGRLSESLMVVLINIIPNGIRDKIKSLIAYISYIK